MCRLLGSDQHILFGISGPQEVVRSCASLPAMQPQHFIDTDEVWVSSDLGV